MVHLTGLLVVVAFSMLIAFNIYMGEVIMRLRADVQIIRKALHIRDKVKRTTGKTLEDLRAATDAP